MLAKQGTGGVARVVAQAVEIENSLAEFVDLSKTNKRSAQDASHGARKLMETIEEKVMEVNKIANEVAQVRFDQLSVAAHNERLEDALEDARKELKELDTLIAKYDAQIRTQSSEIERKQSEVDRLNKKYESLVASSAVENLGPLEAIIYNLQNEISKRSQECVQLQTYWLRSQSEYVQLQHQLGQLVDTMQDDGSKEVILQQQLYRANKEQEHADKQIKALRTSMVRLQRDLEKLNALIDNNVKKREALSASALELNLAVREQIEKGRSEAQVLEEQVEQVATEKDKIVKNMLLLEQEALQWEKKTTLWKETQSALDPTIGAAETTAIKKEIKVMSFKLSRLKRVEELLVSEMERAISKRGTAMMKLTSSKKNSTKEISRESAKKTLIDLAKQLKLVRKAVADVEERILI
jgi:chromosome segregation ATPase